MTTMVDREALGHVLQQRMKRSGMRWNSDGANTMDALRCAYRSTDGLDGVMRQMSGRMAA